MIATDKYTGLSAAQARELLAYDPETGLLAWKITRGKAVAGRTAGFMRTSGYYKTKIGGREYLVHRLAWLIYYGEWPNDQVDHVDGCRVNNKISNLRQVSCSENHQNLKKATARNKLGVLGVCIDRGRIRADIRVGGKLKFLGRYQTIEEAYDAYVKAKRELHPGNTI